MKDKAKHTTVRPRKQTKREAAMESDVFNMLCEGRGDVLDIPVQQVVEWLKESDLIAELAWRFLTMKR